MEKFLPPSSGLFKTFISARAFFLILSGILFCLTNESIAQTTSWKGVSTNFFEAANWTAGVPTVTSDVIIGDANFTGTFNPSFSSNRTIKSITIGGSTKAASFWLTDYKAILIVTGNITLLANGTLKNTAGSIQLSGNWNNSGTYQAESGKAGGKTGYGEVILKGGAQTISGATTFMNLTITQGVTATINNPITVSNTLFVSGILDPGINKVTTTTTFNLGATGIIKVKGIDYGSNYTGVFPAIAAGGAVDFAATDIPQNISALSLTKPFSTLIISGSNTKTLTSNISFTAATTTDGKLLVNSGTLDLAGFTITRANSTGGAINIANAAILKIGGTNSFPVSFATRTLGSASIVEYSGTNQTITAETYGNLSVSASSGAAVKTMPGVAFTIAGNLTSFLGAGTSVSFSAGQNITVNGSLVIGAGTTFNGGAFTHTIDGDWINGGTFTSSTSTVVLRGTGKFITGTANTVLNNLTITGSIRGKATSIIVGGNLLTSGAGTFTHSAEVNGNGAATTGTFTMSGTTKTITGTGFTFDDLVISGTVSSASDLAITGNLNASNTATNSFNLTGGTVWFSGASKTISAGSLTSLNFNALRVTGTVSTGSNFSLKSDFSGNGTFTANAGTITFAGTSTYGGNHKLFGVTLNGTKLQLASNAVLGIANTFTITAGTFDVTTTTPNTVEYNGGAQNITGTTYHSLLLSGSGTKTGSSNFTTNNNLQINAGTTFSPGSITPSIKGNWVNNGTFTAGSSTIEFSGTSDAQVSGVSVTTFANLTLNKSAATTTLTLNNSISAAIVNMNGGEMRTGANTITITGTRTGIGIILGTITRTHTFAANTAYAFEGPNNVLSFGTLSGITSVTVYVNSGSVSNFPFGGSVNRLYNISVNSGGTYSNSSLRLHYQDNELNGNIEGNLNLWSYGSGWVSQGRTSLNGTDNWLEKTGLSSLTGQLTGQWTLSQENVVMEWTGATNNDWNTASNWAAVQGASTERVPLSTDIVDLGGVSYTNQPIIGANASAKSIQFGSAKNVILTLNGGNLIVTGNLSGSWLGNATHTLAVGNQTLTVGGDLILSDGTTGHVINLNVGTGNAYVSRSLIQSGSAAVTFSGSGNISIGNDYQYTNGVFTAGYGTVTYNGSGNQVIAGTINYNNLIVNKTGGTASISAPSSITGNLTLTTGGTFLINSNLTISGNVTIGAGTVMDGGANVQTIGGNWTNNGVFVPSSSTVKFNGSGDQSISATTFNDLTINKPSGTVSLSGNLTINGRNVFLEAGSLDLGNKTLTRSAAGGNFNMLSSSTLFVGGDNNFPANFNVYNLNINSTVYYNGTGTQNVAPVPYGTVIFMYGNTNAKNLLGATTVNGNLTILAGATLNAGSNTLTTNGNITNSGTFNSGTGTVILAGMPTSIDCSAKTTDGNFIFNDLTVTGKYELKSGSFTVNNAFTTSIVGNIAAGNFPAVFSGNFKNEGTMSTNSSVTFSGTQPQTIQLIGTLDATAASIVNFNGTIAPVLNSTASPTFATVTISNTAGITASANWTAGVLFKVFNGATFNGGVLTHTFYRGFVNEGTVTSDGILDFITTGSQTLALGANLSSTGTVKFGGSGLATISTSPGSFTNIEIGNTVGITPPLNWQVNGNLFIKPGSVLNGGAGLTHTLLSNFSNDGTFNGNTSTIIFPANNLPGSVITGSGITNFYHIIFNGAIDIQTDINVKGNFANNSMPTINSGTVNFNGVTGQNIEGAAETTFYDLLISNPMAIVSAIKNLNVANSLIVQTGAVFKPAAEVVINNAAAVGTLGGAGTIEVTRVIAPSDYKNQYKFATYGLTALTVKFSGTTAQSSSITEFFNLTISNKGGFNLSAPTFVTGTLRLENSNIISNGNLLTVGTSAAAPGTVDIAGTGMVLGKLKRWVPASSGTAIQFPVGVTVGTATTRRLATILYTAAPSGGTLTAEFVVADPGKGGLPLNEPNGNDPDITVNNIGTSGFWTISAGTGSESLMGGVYNATLEATSFSGIATFDAFVMLKRPNSTQIWSLNGTHETATGTPSSPIISRQGLTGFSDFALGGRDYAVLPVTLISFKAVSQGSNALLTWSAAQEINSKGYFVEVSADAKNFRELDFVPSYEANSQQIQKYQYVDLENNKQGVRYYRLKQVDLDNEINYYGIKTVNFKKGEALLSAYPNPFSQIVEVMLEADLTEIGTFTLHDLNGKVIWVKEQQLNRGTNRILLTVLENLAKGFYILKVNTGKGAKSIKLLKE